MKTKLLPRQFKKSSFDYTQIERDGNVAIYEQRHPDHTKIDYCVIVIQVGPPHPMDTNPFDGLIERMPSPEQFGALGWNCMDLESARQRFNAALQRLEVAA